MNKKCACCGGKPEGKDGWISFTTFLGTIYFCSMNCLTSGIFCNKRKHTDAKKIITRYRQNNKKEKASKWNALMQKKELSYADLVPFFECLTAKQKKVLALIGLVHSSCDVNKNPQLLLDKINISVKNFFGRV